MATKAVVPQPGETCPTCGRKVPVDSRPKLSEAELRERRREYQARPEVRERQKAYRIKRNAELRELRKLQKQLEQQALEA